jgi:hypothetical protein
MKTQTFNQNFTLDKNARRGLRAVPKTSGGFPEALTGDGLPFDSEQRYFYFDEQARTVRPADSLRRVDADWLGSLGFKVVLISKLRADKDTALSDGQNYFKSQIAELENLVESFETEKAKTAMN